MTTPRRLRWYSVRPLEVAILALVGAVVILLFSASYVRREVARLPEAGRATPQADLDADAGGDT